MKFYFPILILVLVLGWQFIFPVTFAQQNVQTLPPAAGAPAAPAGTTPAAGTTTIRDGDWVQDKDVTFAGKTVNRAQDMFEWTIKYHQWSSLTADSTDNPFSASFIKIRNTVYVLLTLFILATAFLIIITRGQNITVMKFIPRFLLVLFLVTFSFSLVQFIYQITDITQGFFLNLNENPDQPPDYISREDLLNISFPYQGFVGLKRFGLQFEESAYISTLFVKLTALTYYAMATVLLLRKVILWFFIILSPVFPLLFLYFPIRNAGKIWLGEFFRWLLYAPLFAILLSGLVALWKNWQPAVPMPLNEIQFNCGFDDKTAPCRKYPTAINILLGGPQAKVNRENEFTINTDGNFTQYWVALLMLWMVIILPFILLKIFLDNVKNLNISGDNALLSYITTRTAPLANRYGLGPSPKPPTPSSTTPMGSALPIPLYSQAEDASSIENRLERRLSENIDKRSSVSSVSSRTFNQPVFSSSSITNQGAVSSEESSQILKLTNISIPKMTDIVNYETQMITNNTQMTHQLNQVNENLKRIANTSSMVTTQEKQQYQQVRQEVIKSSNAGNPVATTILSASTASSRSLLPVQNKIQQISLEDYEIVKKMWKENYAKLEPPKNVERKNWVKEEEKKVEEAINLLSSSDSEKQAQGKEMVGKILPFLLLGGFSKSEIIAYLKAKKSAASETVQDIEKEEDREDQLLQREQKKEMAGKTMSAKAEMELGEDKKGDSKS